MNSLSSADSQTTIPLTELTPGFVVRVTSLEIATDDATRLKAMGICVGRELQLIRSGDPLILRVIGTRVGLSARLAAGIGVEAISEGLNQQPAA